METIKDLLHQVFSDYAINAAAICEQLEDVKYCTEHGMNHLNGGKEKQAWENAQEKAEKLLDSDHQKTFTPNNIEHFKNSVNKILKNNPKVGLYDGLEETEHYAVRFFYYFGNHQI